MIKRVRSILAARNPSPPGFSSRVPSSRVSSPHIVVTALGLTQILAWGSSYYLPAVLAAPMVKDTGWPLTAVVGGLSLGLFIAGLVSPAVGRRIHHLGGRPVLAASAALLGLGQIGLALSPNLICFFLAWAVLGLGMSAGLYDAAFSTLGQLYQSRARHHIGTLTLFGGFASTLCWPLSAFLLAHLGWRGACFAYAAIQLGFSLPLYLAMIPRGAVDDETADTSKGDVETNGVPARGLFILLASTITIGSMLSTVLSVHLLTMLQGRGLTLAAAVALGTVVGPSQVGARFIELMVSRYHHPIWTKIASVGLVAIGMILLFAKIPLVVLALIFYGGGIGLESIARATLPLALFGPRNYAPIMGRLATPSLIAQAVAPMIGAVLMTGLGAEATLGILVAVGLGNLALVMVLAARTRRG